MFVTMMLVMAPYLVFSVGMGALGGNKVGPRGSCIFGCKVGEDAIGSRVLRWRQRILRSGFGEPALDREAASQRTA